MGHAMITERLKIVDRNHKNNKRALKLFRRPASVSKRPRKSEREKLKKAGKWPPKAGDDDRWPEGYRMKATEEHKKAVAQFRLDQKEVLRKLKIFKKFKRKMQ